MAPITKQLRVYGLVQGVGYRNAIEREAARLGLTGWVRNRLDGTVEAVVQGTPAQVDGMLAFARNHPARSRVERVEVVDAGGNFQAFVRLATD